MDDVTALRDALQTRIDMGARWIEEYRAFDGDEERAEGYRQLDALIAAVEARAALTPERLARAIHRECEAEWDRKATPPATEGCECVCHRPEPAYKCDLCESQHAPTAFTPPATWHEYKPRSNRMGSPCQRCGQSPFYVDHAPPASVRFALSLGVAWLAAEAALPEGWIVSAVGITGVIGTDGKPEAWQAEAIQTTGYDFWAGEDPAEDAEAVGPTPESALAALADALRKEQK